VHADDLLPSVPHPRASLQRDAGEGIRFVLLTTGLEQRSIDELGRLVEVELVALGGDVEKHLEVGARLGAISIIERSKLDAHPGLPRQQTSKVTPRQ
jgi:hypothetical protein